MVFSIFPHSYSNTVKILHLFVTLKIQCGESHVFISALKYMSYNFDFEPNVGLSIDDMLIAIELRRKSLIECTNKFCGKIYTLSLNMTCIADCETWLLLVLLQVIVDCIPKCMAGLGFNY